MLYFLINECLEFSAAFLAYLHGLCSSHFATGVDHDELVKLAEQHFGKIQTASSAYKPAKCGFTGSDVCLMSLFLGRLEIEFEILLQIRHRDDAIEETHIAIAVEGVGWGHPDFLPLMVAQQVCAMDLIRSFIEAITLK